MAGIKALLVIAVAAIYLAVMPRGSGPDQLVRHMQLVAQDIQRVYPFCLLGMCEFSAIVRLDHIRSVPKVEDCPLHKIDGAVAAILSVNIDKSLSAGFFQHSVLVEFLAVCARITGRGYIFHIHLPLLAQLCGRVVAAGMFGFFLVDSTFFR